MSILVLSADDIGALSKTVTASSLANMIGRTMYAITNAAVVDDTHPASSSGSPPIQNPLRIATESDSHKTLYMPSRLTTSQGISISAIKIVSVPKPSTTLPGLPGTTLLLDETTGQVKAVVNSSTLTGLRTAAASALATLLLASPTSQTLVVFGSGVQAYYHARMISELFPSLRQIIFIVRSRTPRSLALVEQLSVEFPNVHVRCAESEETSIWVKQADIICGCVPSTSPVFKADDLKFGVHINAIGSYTPSMFEFPPSLISPTTSSPEIPYILVDSRSACLSESGELIASGIERDNVIELGQVVDILGNPLSVRDKDVAGDGGGEGDLLQRLRSGEHGMTLFKCVGVGGMDVGITALMVEMAQQLGVGVKIPFH